MLLTALTLTVLAGAPARADGEESEQAAMLVEQAIALIANEGGDERVSERIQDALAAPDQEGVDQAPLNQALALIEAPGEDPAATQQARTLLLDSLGGELPSAPAPGEQAVGTETGTSVILDPFRPERQITEVSGIVLAVLSLAAIVAGMLLARRLRPPHTLRYLTHQSSPGRSE